MIRNVLWFLCITAGTVYNGFAQERITLEQCQQWARENYPLIRQLELVERMRDYNLSDASRNYLPQLALKANASWQSEVTQLAVDMPDRVTLTVPEGQLPVTIPAGTTIPMKVGNNQIPVTLPEGVTVPVTLPAGQQLSVPLDAAAIGLPELSADHYQAGVMMTQVLWDGGRIRAGKKVIDAEADAGIEGIEVKLYALKGKINDLYFGILLLDARIQQLKYADEMIGKVAEQVSVARQNGAALAADEDLVEVERLKYNQQRLGLESRRDSYLRVLSRFINRPLSTSVGLECPVVPAVETDDSIRRPELDYLDRMMKRLDADLAVLRADNRPKLGLYAAGGYGRPGLNILSDDFSPFFVGGISLDWKFGTLYTAVNRKKIVRAKQEKLEIDRESFVFNTRMELIEKDGELKCLRRLLEDDARIVRLRENIKKASEVRYAHGNCTMSDLVKDINAEAVARQEKVAREMEYLRAVYQRREAKGGVK